MLFFHENRRDSDAIRLAFAITIYSKKLPKVAQLKGQYLFVRLLILVKQMFTFSRLRASMSAIKIYSQFIFAR